MKITAESHTDVQTDRQTDRQSNNQITKQIDRQPNRQADRQTVKPWLNPAGVDPRTNPLSESDRRIDAVCGSKNGWRERKWISIEMDEEQKINEDSK